MKRMVFISCLFAVCSVSYSQSADSLKLNTANHRSYIDLLSGPLMNIRMTILSEGPATYGLNGQSIMHQNLLIKVPEKNTDKPDWTKTSLQPADKDWVQTIYYQRTFADLYNRPPAGPAAKFWDGPHGTIYGNKSLIGTALFNSILQTSINRKK